MERGNLKFDMQHVDKSFPCSKRSFYVNHFYLITSFVYIFPVVMFIFYLFILVFKNSRFKHDWQFITLKIKIFYSCLWYREFLFVFKQWILENNWKKLYENYQRTLHIKLHLLVKISLKLDQKWLHDSFFFLKTAFTRK